MAVALEVRPEVTGPELTLGGEVFNPDQDVNWSSTQRILPYFWEMYSKELPVLVKITEGYYGSDILEIFDKDEVILVTSSFTQTRVVAKDLTNSQGYISIPYDYERDFEILDETGQGDGQSKCIGEIITEKKLPVTVRMLDNSDVKLTKTFGSEHLANFLRLQLESEYQQRYLAGYRIITGFMTLPCSIPTYLPIKVAIGLGPRSQAVTGEEWGALLSSMKDKAADINHTDLPYNKDIMEHHTIRNSTETKIQDQTMPGYLLKQLMKETRKIPVVMRDREGKKDSDLNRRATAPPAHYTEHAYARLRPKTRPESCVIKQRRPPPRPPRPITTLDAVPEDVSTLSSSQLADCLRLLNMEDTATVLIDKQVNGTLLRELDVDDLQTEFGLSRVAAKKLSMFAIQGWRPKMS